MVKNGDIFTFSLNGKEYKYKVRSTYLYLMNSCLSNDGIFHLLSLDKYDFCSHHYGYATHKGSWPEYKRHDYAAAQRVIDALQVECEKQPTITDKVFCGATITFKINERELKYVVSDDHLYGENCFNDTIFVALGITNISEFCSKCYGYGAGGGAWPQFKQEDFTAATSLVNELQRLCAIHESKSFSTKVEIPKSKSKKQEVLIETYTFNFTLKNKKKLQL